MLLVVAGIAADIMGKIRECGFEISAVFMVSLDKANAEEFLEIYKGVVQEYPMMVTELCAGPCIALEIRAQDAVKMFREFVGPADPVSFQQLNMNNHNDLVVLAGGIILNVNYV